MINVSEYLIEENIIIGLKAKNKKGILKHLLASKGLDKGSILQGIMKREELESTGFGNGLAIPHARIDGVPAMTLLVGVSKEGIEFDALDGKPAKLIFLILAPKSETKLYINILAKLMKVTEKTKSLKELIDCDTPQSFIAKFQSLESM
ncbi:PTS sugar transporter subunit IIA [candidate division WOR-3 bacterium]|nr:PTS sugar transporter subunit IIA [candidate division WOR-3 bacterium]